MKRVFLVVALSISILVATPMAVNAQTVASLQAQIQSLLSMITQLQTQLQAQYGSTTGYTATTPYTSYPTYTSCPTFSGNVSIGARDVGTGSMVSVLQRFLVQQGVYTQGIISGYYGPLTAQAVARLQAQHGLSPVGIVGPQTRTLIARLCGNSSPAPQPVPPYGTGITVTTPTAGASYGYGSSFVVNWNAYGNVPNNAAVRLELWKDGGSVGEGGLASDLALSGSYTVHIPSNAIAQPCVADAGIVCWQGVGGSNYMVKAIVYTPRNACWGFCATDSLPTVYAEGFSGAFSIGGTTNPSGNQAPVVQGFSGPTTLTVGQMGTWSVQAHDPESGSLSYHIDWGDTYTPAYSAQGAYDAYFAQQTTFTHSYSTADTYTVRITVTDQYGLTATATATVRVTNNGGGTVCTLEYAPVCGQPQNNCPSGYYCTLAYPAPKTYGNLCQLQADGAEFLYYGECNNDGSGATAPDSCKVWYDGCNTCSRSYWGGPLACTKRACFQNTGAYCQQSF